MDNAGYSTTRLLIAIAALFPAAGLSRADPVSDEQYLDAAKSTLASQIEPGLPDMKVDEWLGTQVGIELVWTWELNDCGEQTGSPEIDDERDLPICAGLESAQNGRQIFLNFLLGTATIGISESRSAYFVGVSERGVISQFDNLSDLAEYLQNASE